MMSFEASTIAELAISNPGAIPELERLGIDYCCGGNVTVADACSRAGIRPEQLLALVAQADRPEGRAWEKETISALVRFILDTVDVDDVVDQVGSRAALAEGAGRARRAGGA